MDTGDTSYGQCPRIQFEPFAQIQGNQNIYARKQTRDYDRIHLKRPPVFYRKEI